LTEADADFAEDAEMRPAPGLHAEGAATSRRRCRDGDRRDGGRSGKRAGGRCRGGAVPCITEARADVGPDVVVLLQVEEDADVGAETPTRGVVGRRVRE